MPIKTIHFNGRKYPAFQSTGNAARWITPFALELCKGKGLDVGCNRPEWCLPDAQPHDPSIGTWMDATHLPPGPWDYIFSSHMLEHYNGSWVDVLEYWHSKLVPGGVLFLYLPDSATQEYWRPWHNRKHVHNFTPGIFKAYMQDVNLWTNWFVTGVDLNNSFVVVGEKI